MRLKQVVLQFYSQDIRVFMQLVGPKIGAHPSYSEPQFLTQTNLLGRQPSLLQSEVHPFRMLKQAI